jgi:predicted ATP-binding protein involved in virulence
MEQSPPKIRLSRIEITNYKKIDHLVIDFPKPLMANDPDVFVLGSKNGGGKTSVLECCGLAVLALYEGEKLSRILEDFNDGYNYLEVCIGIYQSHFEIEAVFDTTEGIIKSSLLIEKKERSIRGSTLKIKSQSKNYFLKKNHPNETHKLNNQEYFLKSLFSLNNDTASINNTLFFNAFRKTSNTNPDLRLVSTTNDAYNQNIYVKIRRRSLIDSPFNNSISAFKIDVMQLQMSQANLFEDTNQNDSGEILLALEKLLYRYSKTELSKMKVMPDNSLEIRLNPIKSKDTISFDALSSGQKEIISTLFLIYKNTKNNPSIVIIDEPELHLNAEWQQDYVYQLTKLMPHNQYILATHSKWIANGVEDNQRTLLEDDEE